MQPKLSPAERLSPVVTTPAHRPTGIVSGAQQIAASGKSSHSQPQRSPSRRVDDDGIWSQDPRKGARNTASGAPVEVYRKPILTSMDAAVVRDFLEEMNDYQMYLVGQSQPHMPLWHLLSRKVRHGLKAVALIKGVDLPRHSEDVTIDEYDAGDEEVTEDWETVVLKLLSDIAKAPSAAGSVDLGRVERDLRKAVQWNLTKT